MRSFGASPRMAVAAVRRKLDDRDAGHLDRVLHGQEQAGAGPLVDGHREHVLAVEGDRAAGDGVLRVAGDRVGQGGLAGAVGAHDGVGLARPARSGRRPRRISSVAVGLDGDVQVADLEGGHRQ